MSQMTKRDDHAIDITTRYERAQTLQAGIGTKSVAFNTKLFPHWVGSSDTFWYTRETRTGQVYRLVDAKTGSNEAAFDHSAIASSLSLASGESVAADNLSLTDIDFTGSESITFSALNRRWAYQHSNKSCKEIAAHPPSWKVSPDGKQAVYLCDYN